jgi:hypothetical protein
MGKLNCKCGNTISDVSSPCDYVGWLMSDRAAEDSNAVHIEGCNSVCECNSCGRIAVDNGKSGGVVWFTPDSGKYEGVCK